MMQMHIKKIKQAACICMLVFFVATHQIKAQAVMKGFYGKEFGLSLGAAYYIGDINPYIPMVGARPSAGVYFRLNRDYRWSFRTNFVYGMVTGNDNNNNLTALKERNLKFQSNLFELSEQIEFNFWPYRVDEDNYSFSPYAFIGLGAFYFNPKAKYNNELVALQPLKTEGQGLLNYRKPYNRVALAVPMGMGIKIGLVEKWTLQFEYSIRKTNTDYLDDVSSTYKDPNLIKANTGAIAAQLSDPSANAKSYANVGHLRGNPDTNDWYGFLHASLSYSLPNKRKHCPAQ
jgi:opacity protein-like surface antigen